MDRKKPKRHLKRREEQMSIKTHKIQRESDLKKGSV